MNDTMTWKQFKEYVDAELKKQGVSEDAKIAWIDIHEPCMPSPDSKYGYKVPDVFESDGEIQVH